ncbi:GH22618 [Drosophila grimshawi]|uniref:GH22618 n=1 Tax=Drosophila grimshawi TaxID=7222 RepID=B4K1X9_DROGR|nr:GH22618 [Drosophila grimshawi]
MGSLPNLHELEAAERKREKRREYELLLEQRARDTSRERERLSIFAQQRKQSSYNAYIMAGLGIGGGSLSLTATATASSTVAANGHGSGNGDLASGNSAKSQAVAAVAATTTTTIATATATSSSSVAATKMLSSFAMLGLVTKKYSHPYHPHQQHQHQHHHQQHQQHQQHHQHRHSLTTRHRVLRTRTRSSGGAQNLWDEQMMEVSARMAGGFRRWIVNCGWDILPINAAECKHNTATNNRNMRANCSIYL